MLQEHNALRSLAAIVCAGEELLCKMNCWLYFHFVETPVSLCHHH